MLDDSPENCIKVEAIFCLNRLNARRIVRAVWKSRNSCATGSGLNNLDCQAFSIFVSSPAHRRVSFEYRIINDALPRTRNVSPLSKNDSIHFLAIRVKLVPVV